MLVYNGLVSRDFKWNPYEEEGSRGPRQDSAIKAGCEVGVVCAPCEAVVPQDSPTKLLHILHYGSLDLLELI